MSPGGDVLDETFVREFLRKLGAAGCAMDAGAVAALCTEDVLFEDATRSGAMRGRWLVEELFGGIFGVMVWMDFELVGAPFVSSDSQTAAARWRVAGLTGDGDPVGFESVDLYRFSHGLVSEYTMFVRDPNWLDRLTR